MTTGLETHSNAPWWWDPVRVAERSIPEGPAGAVLRANLRRIRLGQGLSYAALSERMRMSGRALPPLSLSRIETGRRRVDLDDVMALAVALGVTVVDLVVPGSLEPEAPWWATPAVSVPAGAAREWIGGRRLLQPPVTAAELAQVIRWMPQQRARELARQWSAPATAR